MPTVITHGAMSAYAMGFGAKAAGLGYTYSWVFTTGTSSFTVPTGVTSMTVEAIGAGGSVTGLSTGTGGGGGAAYAKSIVSVTPGNTVYYSIGTVVAGGTGNDSWLNIAANSAPSSSANGVLAKGGGGTSTTSGGAGGSSASSVGTTTYSGGAGGTRGSVSVASGGGGGAGGANGAGGNGGNGTSSGTVAGGGGGGAGGASTTAGGAGTSNLGGTGGTGPTGGAGGAGSNGSTAGVKGTNGGGGGGGAGPQLQGNGSTFDYWGAGYGPGSGAGGASNTSYIPIGGAYGGGAGGTSYTSGVANSAGPGIVVVTFTIATQASGQITVFPGATISPSFIAGIDSLGNSYLVGLNTITSPTSLSIVKVSPTGSIVWQRNLSFSASFDSSPFAICDSSFNTYVFGTYYSSSNFYGFLAKYNSSGVLQWQRTFQNNAGTYWPATGGNMAIDSAGNIWAAFVDKSAYQRACLVNYNPSGTYLAGYSITTTPGVFNTSGFHVFSDPAGYLYFTTSEVFVYCCCGPSTQYYSNLYKYSNSLSAQWGKTDGTGYGVNYPNGVAVDSSSNVYYGSYTYYSGYAVGAVSKFNSSGTIQWTAEVYPSSGYISPVQSYPNLSIDSAGNTYSAWKTTNGYQFFYWKLNSSGTTQYTKYFSGAPYPSSTYATPTSLIISAANNNLLNYPAAGLTAGTYGPYTAGDVTVTTGTSSVTTTKALTAFSAVTFTDAAGSLTDAAGTLTTVTGWL